nr:hypothetical protein [Tanacetum cinerariifolium]
MHHQTLPLLIHLHHRDLFIHRLLGLHGVARLISVGGLPPLSTMYLPNTFESSAEDSSFKSSVGPSRKRCRSSVATVTSSIHATRDLVLSCVDLLPPRKRFRDSISPKDSVEEDNYIDVLKDIEADAVTIKDEVEDEVESSNRVTIEVGVDMAVGIDILMEALAAYEVTHAANALEAKNQSQNGSDGDNGNGRNRNGGDGDGGDGNGGDGNGGNGNPNENNRGARPVAQECTYQDFIKCQPLNFKGTEGVVKCPTFLHFPHLIMHGPS